VTPDATDADGGEVLACGDAGSVIIFHGSVWHGHTANRSSQRRRSVQGAFIPREARAAIDQASRIRPETRQRLGDLAKYVLDVGQVAEPDAAPDPARR
jgi:ectoine hydroxylase-related dioxygenase (phytanoyl-CoA dioxygenase family)